MMKSRFIDFGSAKKIVFVFGLTFVFAQIFCTENAAQTRRKTVSQTSKNKAIKTNAAPRVTQIDALALRKLVSRDASNDKPLLVNFWATWCVPCLAEFPELVKIDGDYKNKIDFVVVSLDDLAEIKRDVPQFLTKMKASMPAYLLKTADEQAAIASIAKNYEGALPFTILLDRSGEIVYTKKGKADAAILRGEIDKLLSGEIIK